MSDVRQKLTALSAGFRCGYVRTPATIFPTDWIAYAFDSVSHEASTLLKTFNIYYK